MAENKEVSEIQEIQNIENMIYSIVSNLTGRKDDVRVVCLNGDRSTVIEVSVPKEEVGKIIGRSGRIANAIRALVAASAAGQKVKRRISLEILD